MSTPAQDEASARSQRFLTRYSKTAADRIWGLIFRYELGPEWIPELVDNEVEVFGAMLDTENATEPDRTQILDFLRLAIVREGKQLAILLDMEEGGTA